MSILIKGMEMPTGCLSCDFCNPFVDEPYCRRLMRRTPKVSRLDGCPLIEIPPHGRLIDADALRLSHCVECTLHPDKCLKDECDWGSIYHIDHATTIIPAEEGE